MNSIKIVIFLVACAIQVTSSLFINIDFDISGHRRQKLCSNYTALDLNWDNVIEPLNNWNLFYMNYDMPSFYETGNLSTCIQINFTTQKAPGSIIGKYTSTKLTTSNTKNNEIRYIYSSIADVKKECVGTWMVSIPEKDIELHLTMPIYDPIKKYFCLAQCNNQCGKGRDTPNGTFECFGKTKEAAEYFKQQHPNLAKKGQFLKCSLEE